MGNQQSRDELQFCSTRTHPLAERFMVDKAFRVDYASLKTKNMEAMRLPKQQQLRVVQQQRVRDVGTQQQEQEEFKDIPMKAPCMSKINIQIQEDEVRKVDVKEMRTEVFEGVFGKISLCSNGLVEYTDIIGNDFREKYDSQKIQKTFPLGISYGGLTKSLWFKDVEERDVCFDAMTGILPPSYAEVVANPEKFQIPDTLIPLKMKVDTRNVKVFDGIKDNVVYVYKGYHVKYVDLDGGKHSVSYNKNRIRKCFPHGICFGGLDRTLWLKDEIERDLCFSLMQIIGEEKEEKNIFSGLYGKVVLEGNEVSFTSLVGERIEAASYDSESIYRVFPLGINGGGLPHSIWFKEIDDLENCFEKMAQKCE